MRKIPGLDANKLMLIKELLLTSELFLIIFISPLRRVLKNLLQVRIGENKI